MRVAFLTPEVIPAYGWARYGVDLAYALGRQRVEVVAVTQRGSLPPDAAHLLADVRPVLPQLYPPVRGFLARSLLALPQTRRAVADCDLVHVIAEPYTPLGALVGGRRPLVVTAHGTYVPMTARRRLVGGLYRRAYCRAALIAVSRYTAEQVQSALPGVDPVVIHNGVHYDQFQLPADCPPEKTGPVVLATGGVKERKGTHMLVAALARVVQQVPDVQLVVTGGQEPAYLARLQSQIARLGLADRVLLPGHVTQCELLGWYQSADVFALPSQNVGQKFEGFGLVFLEAGACGLPVIGTTGSGVEEAVIDGETGLLVPQDDADALADAIVRLLTDRALHQRLGTAGREHARQQDWSHIAERVQAFYGQILG
ncbi:MAG: glycosyltransferase family 4 protein [Chloroflexi bacterium]|nr:glycosyltransferase family 4 protein [Chloroflexota bacterium]